jgi:hypothetical protein
MSGENTPIVNTTFCQILSANLCFWSIRRLLLSPVSAHEGGPNHCVSNLTQWLMSRLLISDVLSRRL